VNVHALQIYESHDDLTELQDFPDSSSSGGRTDTYAVDQVECETASLTATADQVSPDYHLMLFERRLYIQTFCERCKYDPTNFNVLKIMADSCLASS
jgi:hypothetical protein